MVMFRVLVERKCTAQGPRQWSNHARTYLGHKHQSLPNHESGEYNHCQIEYLKRQLALVGPELFELHHLLVYHILNHVTVNVGFGLVDEL